MIACEVVELMSMVPPFLDGIRTDEGRLLLWLLAANAIINNLFSIPRS